MNHGSLFSGIGGFDLAAEWMGWNNVFHCEINEFGRKILKHYWPKAISYEDITKTDFTIHRGTIDILTGGFPCQPYSVAGNRKGKADDRHLWPEMLRAIREIRPASIVGENVAGIINMELENVCIDLEKEGYEVQPIIIPACGVNAPHRRYRVWIIANYNNRFTQQSKIEIQARRNSAYDKAENATNSNGFVRCERWMYKAEQKKTERYFSTFNPRNNGNSWQNFPTQSPVCGRNDGVPNRVDRIKALGNAIVPQIAYEIFKAIELTDTKIN